MDSFLKAMHNELAATKQVRERIKQSRVEANEDYHTVLENAHGVVGSTIPIKREVTSTLKSKQTQKKTQERSIPQSVPEIPKEKHVHFDFQNSRTLPRNLK